MSSLPNIRKLVRLTKQQSGPTGALTLADQMLKLLEGDRRTLSPAKYAEVKAELESIKAEVQPPTPPK